MSELTVLSGCATIQLTKGQNTLVDEAGYPTLSRFSWCAVDANGVFYAARHIWHGRDCRPRQTRIYMHREVAELQRPDDVPMPQTDHRNRDTLDNRSENLRPATIGQNRSNSRKKLWRGGKSSEYKGVSWHKASRRWRAVIVKDKAQRELGYYESEIDAARAYNRAAIEAHGEFARINEGV